MGILSSISKAVGLARDPKALFNYRTALFKQDRSSLIARIKAAKDKGEDLSELVNEGKRLGTNYKSIRDNYKSFLKDTDDTLTIKADTAGSVKDKLTPHAMGDINRMKGFAIFGAGAGILGGIMSGENPIWGGIKGAATGAMFGALFPVISGIDTVSAIAETALGIESSLSQMDRSVQVTRLNRNENYNPVGPPSPDAGNMRRRSLAYQNSSRQNTNSFLGSEASFYHNNS